jgi:Tfp pilus assembly protein PilN
MIERIEINLLPAEYRVHKKTLQLQREIVYPILGLGLIGFVLMLWTLKLDTSISQIKNDIAYTEKMIKTNKPIQDEIVRLKESKNIIHGKIQALEQITVDRGKWVRLMEVLCQRLPDFTWIQTCEEKDESLIIDGKTFSFPEVANFMSRLSESPYIKLVDLSGIEEKDAKTFSFSITCKLNPKPVIKEVVSGKPAQSGNQEREVR